MAQELAGLVVQGIKQATASLLWEYELGLLARSPLALFQY